MKNEIATLRNQIDNLTLENKNLHRKFSTGIRSSGQPVHSANFSHGSYLRPPSTASQMPHSAPFQPVQSHSRYGSHHYIGTQESKSGRSPKQIVSPAQQVSPSRIPASGRNFVSTGNFTPTPQQNLGASSSSNFNLQNFNQNATVGQSMQGSIGDPGAPGFEGLSDMAANISLSAPDNDKYQTQSSFLKEKLREKEDEVKILWSVIKDFNKKRNEGQQLSAEDMKQHIQSKIETSPYKV